MSAKTKKALLITADVLLYIVGFPALVIIGYLCSREFVAKDIYGVIGYVPLILCGLMMLVCGIVEICFRASSKKVMAEGRKHRSSFKKQTMRMCIAVVACLCGLMFIIDTVFPAFFSDATQGTVTYEMVVENYSAQNDAQRALVDTFIEWNVENGNLTKKTYAAIDKAVDDGTLTGMTKTEYKEAFETASNYYRGGTYYHPVTVSTTSAWDDSDFAAISDKKAGIIAEYKIEALNNEEITTLLENTFNSIDAAYSAFDPLMIEMAMEDFNAIMSGDGLESVTAKYVSDSKIRLGIDKKTGKKKVAISADLVSADAENLTAAGLDPNDKFLYRWTILEMLGEVPEIIVEMGITGVFDVVFDADGKAVSANERRGIIDYMHSAWLDSVGLLGIISLFSVRNVFYIFAAWIAVLTLIRGAIRIAYKKAADKDVDNAAVNADETANSEPPVEGEQAIVVEEQVEA